MFIVKKMQIFEPAMCCSTGICGVGVDPELLRISAVLNTLKKNEILVERFNLTSAPMEFVNNKIVNDFININGVDQLPIVLLDGVIIISGRYPANEEFIRLLNLPNDLLVKQETKVKLKKFSKCHCKGGCCE
jgi:hypothetical protein